MSAPADEEADLRADERGRSNAQPPSRLERLLALVETDPTDTFCLYGLAQEYAKLGNLSDALMWYDRCLAADPNYCYAYFHKAKAFESAERVDEAVKTLRVGLDRARQCGDRHAASEISAYLDQLDDELT